jgi:hypothetical protein
MKTTLHIILHGALLTLASGALALLASTAQAIPVLSFENANTNIQQTYFQGDTINIGLWISGLEGTDTSGGFDLGGFDLNLSYNGAVTDYQNTTFNSALDDSAFLFLSADQLSLHLTNLAGISVEEDLSGQADQFQLFTLAFTANQLGTSLLQLDSSLLSNSQASELLSSNFLAEITVVEKPVSVTEPGSLVLMGIGLFGIIHLRRRS